MPPRKPPVSVEELRGACADAVEATGLRQVAREIGISHPTLRDFLAGAEPYAKSLVKLRDWYASQRGDELSRLRAENAALRERIADLEAQLQERSK